MQGALALRTEAYEQYAAADHPPLAELAGGAVRTAADGPFSAACRGILRMEYRVEGGRHGCGNDALKIRL